MSDEVGSVNVSATETQTDTAGSVSSTEQQEVNTSQNVALTTETETATETKAQAETETGTDSKTQQDAGNVEDSLDKFSFSDDFGFDDKTKEQALEIMKSFGVSKKSQAENVVKFLETIESTRLEDEKKSKEEMLTRWDKVLDADKDFSRNYDANIALANKALKQYGGQELESWLVKTGFNRNPDIVKMFYRIGKDLEDAKVLTGAQSSANKVQHDKFGNATFNLTKSFGDK